MASSSGKNDVNQNIAEGEGSTTSQISRERTLEYRGGYSVMSPNEKKRTEIQAQAEREMKYYEQYKSELCYGYVSERPAAVGGSSVSRNTAMKSLQVKQKQSERRATLEKKKKREQWEAEKKRKEEEEINVRKSEARRQAERNERRDQQREVERTKQFKEDQRRRNLAFFDKKNENEQRSQRKDTILPNTLRQNCKQEDEEWPPMSQRQHLSHDKDIDALCEMFPNFNIESIIDIYESTNKNIHISADILATSK